MIVRFTRLMIMLNCVFCGHYTLGYTYRFSNHTPVPLMVRLQLNGINEEWHTRQIMPNKTVEFLWVAAGHPRQAEGIDVGRAGFCLQNIDFALPIKTKRKVTAPDGEDLGYKTVFEKDALGRILYGAWTRVNIKWVQDEGVNAIIKASEGFANDLVDMATGIAQAVSSASSVD